MRTDGTTRSGRPVHRIAGERSSEGMTGLVRSNTTVHLKEKLDGVLQKSWQPSGK